METPITIEMDQRKANLAGMIYNAKENPEIDNDDIMNLFDSASKELEYYKYFGENIRIKNFMLSEMETNANGLKGFLEGTLSGVPMHLVILSYLK